jgi:GT2 family glycosyltransferase
VYVDSSIDGTIEWLEENKIKYILNESSIPKGIAHAYNRCIESAETDIVCMFHADMFMGKDFDIHVLKHLKQKTIVAGTRIEPPLHPEGKEKIVKDFGMYPEDFIENKFNEYVKQEQIDSNNLVTFGIFAPWACYKSDIVGMGLHEEFFHSYHEDSDIFNRMLLNGMKIIQSRDALVYHFTCRGGQFQEGIEKITNDSAFHIMKNNAARNYLRKWGSWIKNDEYQHPILTPKYNIAYAITNCNLAILEALEPWCDRIYIKDDSQLVLGTYIDKEQNNTLYDLTKRVFYIDHNDAHGENDIVVELDAKRLDQDLFRLIQQLPEIIASSGEIGAFELGPLKVNINNLQPIEIPIKPLFSTLS